MAPGPPPRGTDRGGVPGRRARRRGVPLSRALRAVQYRPPADDPDAARRALVALARQAADGAAVVVLPELAPTPYLWPGPAAIARVAEPADGPTLRALAPVARDAGCHLVVGIAERDGDALFNSALVIDPAGALAFTYRKTLLFDADWSWARPGDSGYVHLDTDVGRVGVGICMDLNDDRLVSWAAGADLDWLAFPTSWLHEGPPADLFAYWARRCGPARMGLIAGDRWGWEGPIRFAGSSAVMARDGRILAKLGEDGDGVVGAPVRGS